MALAVSSVQEVAVLGWNEARLLAHIARWRMTWAKYDLDHLPTGLGPKFVTGRPLPN